MPDLVPVQREFGPIPHRADADAAEGCVFLGDDYSWIAKFDYDSLPSTWQARVDYTMDVPEPALGVVLLGGLAAVGIAGKRRR